MSPRNLAFFTAFALTMAAFQTSLDSLRFVAKVWVTTPAFWGVAALTLGAIGWDWIAGRSIDSDEQTIDITDA